MTESKWWHGLIYRIAERVLLLWIICLVAGFLHRPFWSAKFLVNIPPLIAVVWAVFSAFRDETTERDAQ